MKSKFVFGVLLILGGTLSSCKFLPKKDKIVTSFYPYTFAAKYLGRTDYDYITVYRDVFSKSLNMEKSKLENIKAKLLVINGNKVDDNLKNEINYEDILVASKYSKYEKPNYLVYLNPDKMEDIFFALSQRFCEYDKKKCKYFSKRCGDYVALIEEVKEKLKNLAQEIIKKNVKIFLSSNILLPLFDFMKVKTHNLNKENIEKLKGKKIIIFASNKEKRRYENLLKRYNLKYIIFDPNLKEDYAKAFIAFYKKMEEILK